MENGLIQNNFLESFEFEGMSQPTEYIETMEVADGVRCDVYRFVGDVDKDLGIIKVEAGYQTPLQKVLKGQRTVEGYVSGAGKLIVTRSNNEREVYDVGTNLPKVSIDIGIGDTMQWQAAEYEGLIAYEVCIPPYEDGRYENLPSQN